MYFLRIGKLSEDLKNNLIDQNEAFKYFFGLIFLRIGSYSLHSIPEFPPFLTTTGQILSAIVLIIFFRIFYLINKSGDNKNVLIRTVSLLFVVNIYPLILTLLLFPLYIVGAVLMLKFKPSLLFEITQNKTILYSSLVALVTITNIILNTLVAYKLKYISQK
ncbi:hypothetical protein A3F66_04000 [candidate division TM6 bacterium RIFCSPHIGHO2_12_FULL_32_22]|nr:MAG: hypothetical protein A3F66_04000 [candidate division TM6 bacterium RIFCSPHIGHO2_12_FULL_32_22]